MFFLRSQREQALAQRQVLQDITAFETASVDQLLRDRLTQRVQGEKSRKGPCEAVIR